MIDGCLKVSSVFTGLSEAIESSCKRVTSFFKVQKVYMPIQQVLMKDMVVGLEPSTLRSWLPNHAHKEIADKF